jgi:putative transposase
MEGKSCGGEVMDWKHLLAYITGTVDQALLLRNAYLVTENRLLRNQLQGRVRLTDAERKILAELGVKLGKQALEEVATIVKPDTILAWHRKLPEAPWHPARSRAQKDDDMARVYPSTYGGPRRYRFLHD